VAAAGSGHTRAVREAVRAKGGWLFTSLFLGALVCGSSLATPYTVQKGDTLYRLARSVGLSVTQLQVLNGLTGVDVKVGQVLELPSVPGSPPQAQPQGAPSGPIPSARTTVQVSRPGCCVNAQWTPDSMQLSVLNRPPGGAVGLYRLPADGSSPDGVFSRAPALLSPDGAYAIEPLGPSSATAQRLSDNARAPVPTSGGSAFWSPAGQLAWATYGNANRDDWIPLTVFVTSPFTAGAAVQRLPTVYGGRLIGWLNATTVLLTGHLNRTDTRRAVMKVDVPSKTVQVLARGNWLSGVQVSPDGQRVVYRVTLDTPGLNGMFVVDTATRTVVPLPLFGSARWQDAGHLLVIPFEPGQDSQRLAQLDVMSGAVVTLLSLQDKVVHDDWQVSPDGRRAVYLSQTDRALHVLSLPVSEVSPLLPEPTQTAPPVLQNPPSTAPAPAPLNPPLTAPPPVPVLPPAPTTP